MKRLSTLTCCWLAMGVMSAFCAEVITVTAENFETCRKMEAGKIYRFAESMDYEAAIGDSAMALTNGTAGILVPAGVRVSLKGGAASGRAGAGAGIEVSANATLYVYGDGELVGTGGAAAAGASGANGTAGLVSVRDAASLFELATVQSCGGTGGAGGNGGGGAGAGLGGRGGNGGNGAAETKAESVSNGDAEGEDGKPGNSGEDGGACGEVLVYGQKTFHGGAVTTTNQTNGAAGEAACAEANSAFYAAFGGGSGGAGGDGGTAADIGGGGGGGFGGGAGGCGICKRGISRETVLSEEEPVRGERGVAGSSGAMGDSGTRLAPTDGTVNGGSVWKGEGSGWYYDALENQVVLLEEGPYDIRGDVSVNGNGRYRVTFPDSPIVLWLENGDYTFRFATVEKGCVVEHYYNAVVNGFDVVSDEVSPLVLGVTVNGENVGSLMGTGWIYSPASKCLILDGKVPYVISGADNFGNVQVMVRGDAEVTLANLRLSGSGGEADCFRVADGASVRLGLVGTNVLQAVEADGAGIRVEGTSHLEIDSEGDGATLVVRGGDGTPCVCVERAASLAVNGGLLYAMNGATATVCIGGDERGSGTLTVTGGTVAPLGEGPATNITCAAAVIGGSIWPDFASAPTNVLGQVLYRVTVEGLEGSGGSVEIEGLDNYGTDDIYAIDGKAYLWLPNGWYQFTVNGQEYAASVQDAATTAFRVETVETVSYLNWNGAAMERGTTDAIKLTADFKVIGNDRWYVVTDEVSTTDLKVNGAVHLILADGATLTAVGMNRCAGISVNEGNALTIYGQREGSGVLNVQGGNGGAGIGGDEMKYAGVITVNGGMVNATGGEFGAGIGSGNYAGRERDFGTVTINGGVVKATGDGDYAAGIGGGFGTGKGTVIINGGFITASAGRSAAGIGSGGNYNPDGADVTVNGGTVVASSAGKDDIGLGYSPAGSLGTLTINGGSVYRPHGTGTVPTNAANEAVYCVTVKGLEGLAHLEGLEGYGVKDIYPIDGKAYLWLPNGWYQFTVDGQEYAASVQDAATTAFQAETVETVACLNWNGATMERRTTDAIKLTADFKEICGDRWYVVMGEVSTTDLKVNGAVRLILADGATLTATNGIHVTEGNALNIYAQSEGDGMGKLIATGADRCAGIGGTIEAVGGAIAIHGGCVTAEGGEFAAGIGGGRETANGSVVIYGGQVNAHGCYGAGIGGGQNGACGTVTINGGMVTASGDVPDVIGGAGIGGGGSNGAGAITINGGVVMATGGVRCAGIGCSFGGTGGAVVVNGGRVMATGGSFGIGGSDVAVAVSGGTVMATGGGISPDIGGLDGAVTIDGGNILSTRPLINPAPTNAAHEAVHCVTVQIKGHEIKDKRVDIEGLGEYGVRDVYPIDGKVCLWLPDGEYAFTVNGVTCLATVAGGPATALTVTEVAYLDSDGVEKKVWAHPLDDDSKVVDGNCWYAVTNDVTTTDLKVNGTANLILVDGATLTANGGVCVTEGNALNIYAQSNDTNHMGRLNATGAANCAGIGGGNGHANGTISIHGGIVTATGGGTGAAGIGGGYQGAGGNILISGGVVKAVGSNMGAGIGGGHRGAVGVITISGGLVTAEARGGTYASGAGIGSGQLGAGGTITISGGTVTATGDQAGAGIGGGYQGYGGTITIGGGTVNAKTKGGGAAGIGSGSGRGNDTIVITGGDVTATDDGSCAGAGIGGGYQGQGCMVRISGGVVRAKVGGSGAGIGGGCNGAGGTVTISGGTVMATGGGGADIGSGAGGSNGSVTITGGNVFATRVLVSPAPTNGVSQAVYCVTLDSLEGLASLDGLEGYGTKDIYAVDGNVCLWLPNGTYAFTVDGVGYVATVANGPTTAVRTNKAAAVTLERIAASVRAMVSNLDLGALTAAPVAANEAARPESAPYLMALRANAADGIDLTVAGGVLGVAYTLCAAGELEALGDGGAGATAVKTYGPETCGADGTVTFRNVCRPAGKQGFFTIRYER